MRVFGLLLCTAVLAGCQTPSEHATPTASLVVEDVTVIDPETRRVLPHHDVVVNGDRIVDLLPHHLAKRHSAAATVDGRGRFLIPGLMDMHVHLFLPENPTPTMNLLLAYGVTGIREMASDCWELAGATEGCARDYRLLQARTKSAEVAGPEILRMASTMIMGPSNLKVPAGVDPFIAPSTPEEARRLVRYLKSRGVEIVKTHDSIPRDVFFALLDEGNKAGLEVSGHVPFGAGTLGAAERGYGSIEHARDLLYDCSRYGVEFRKRASDFADGRAGAEKPANYERLTRTVDEFDPHLCSAMLAKVARTGTYYVPTHVTREMEARASDPGYRNDPGRKYVSADRSASWEADLDQTAALPPAERAALARFFTHGLTITGMAFRAGVPVMAGTDANDTMIIPGLSLHSELALLARAGLPAMDVLRAATTVPAAYLRKSALYGGIAAGKEADLVLLRANPLDDVSNSRSVEAVVTNGRVYDRRGLDHLLDEAEAYVTR